MVNLSSTSPTNQRHPTANGPATSSSNEAVRARKRRYGLPHQLAFLGMVMMGLGTTRIAAFTVSDWIFLAAVGALVLDLLTGNRRKLAPIAMRRSPRLILFGTLLMITGGTFSTLLSTEPLSSAGYVPRLGWLTLAWFWLLRSVSPDDSALAHLIKGFKIAILIGAGAAILGHMGIAQFNQLEGMYDTRQAGFYQHPNSFSGFLMTGLPFFILDVPRQARQNNVLLRRLLPSGMVLLALGISGSMSAIGAGVVGFAVIGLVALFVQSKTQPASPLRRILSILVIGMAFTLILTTDNPAFERFARWQRGEAHVSESVDSRAEHTQFVIDDIQSLLIVGKGFGPEAAGTEEFTTAARGIHNMYLKILYEGGLITLLGIGLIFLETIRQSRRLLWQTRHTVQFPLVLAFIAAITTNMIRAAFQPTLTDRFFWLPIALTGVLWAICRHELRSPHAPDVMSDASRRPTLIEPAR